jgi:hypothetical protein
MEWAEGEKTTVHLSCRLEYFLHIKVVTIQKLTSSLGPAKSHSVAI